MTDDALIVIDARGLGGPHRVQLAAILGRAAAAPSIEPPVADLLTRAAAGARLAIPVEIRDAEMRRRLDDALTPDGRLRARWEG